MPGRFVGRSHVQGVFAKIIASDGPAAVFIHGAGGSGKTALVSVFAGMAADAGLAVAQLDLWNVVPSRGALRHAAQEALAGSAGRRTVLVADDCVHPGDVAAWLRRYWASDLPDDAVLVIAGRQPVPASLRTELGWPGAIEVMPLADLEPAEAVRYLDEAGVPTAEHGPIVRMSGGNPLALALLTDLALRDRLPERLDDDMEFVRQLIDGIVEPVPSPRHRRALQASAHLRHTTEDLLAAVVEGEAAELFEWLRRQPFMTASPRGLAPSELVRTIVDADLRWRDRTAYGALHEALMDRLLSRVRQDGGELDDRFRDAIEAIYLNRTRFPGLLGRGDWSAWRFLEEARIRCFRAGDGDQVRALAESSLSAANLTHVQARLRHLTGDEVVFRDGHGAIFAFGTRDVTTADRLIGSDPVTAAVRAHITDHGPTRRDERVSITRVDAFQPEHAGQAVTVGVAWIAYHATSGPWSSWDFLVITEPQQWSDSLAYFDLHHVATVRLDGEPVGVFAHDWRRLGLDAWVTKLLDQPWDAVQAPPTGVSGRVLVDEAEFASAVRSALRDLHSDRRLAVNPLVDSRLVRGADPTSPPEVRLRTVIRTAADVLRAHEETASLYRILDRIYLRPAGSQQDIADSMSMPFTTFRRRRNRAVDLLTDELWRAERGGYARPG